MCVPAEAPCHKAIRATYFFSFESMPTHKATLRKSLLVARLALPAEQRKRCDTAICERLLAWLSLQSHMAIGVYWPIQGEPDLRPIYAALVKGGATLALPLVSQRNAALTFSVWRPGDALMKDACGVPVPAVQSAQVSPDLVLVPCVGFNRDLFRIGYGAGYYDHTLAESPHLRSLGIAYDAALTRFDPDAHDVPLDVVLTETAVLAQKGPTAARSLPSRQPD
jgi:5-formyltetrahydrofolate cyclo-ligase